MIRAKRRIRFQVIYAWSLLCLFSAQGLQASQISLTPLGPVICQQLLEPAPQVRHLSERELPLVTHFLSDALTQVENRIPNGTAITIDRNQSFAFDLLRDGAKVKRLGRAATELSLALKSLARKAENGWPVIAEIHGREQIFQYISQIRQKIDQMSSELEGRQGNQESQLYDDPLIFRGGDLIKREKFREFTITSLRFGLLSTVALYFASSPDSVVSASSVVWGLVAAYFFYDNLPTLIGQDRFRPESLLGGEIGQRARNQMANGQTIRPTEFWQGLLRLESQLADDGSVQAIPSWQLLSSTQIVSKHFARYLKSSQRGEDPEQTLNALASEVENLATEPQPSSEDELLSLQYFLDNRPGSEPTLYVIQHFEPLHHRRFGFKKPKPDRERQSAGSWLPAWEGAGNPVPVPVRVR